MKRVIRFCVMPGEKRLQRLGSEQISALGGEIEAFASIDEAVRCARGCRCGEEIVVHEIEVSESSLASSATDFFRKCHFLRPKELTLTVVRWHSHRLQRAPLQWQKSESWVDRLQYV